MKTRTIITLIVSTILFSDAYLYHYLLRQRRTRYNWIKIKPYYDKSSNKTKIKI